MASKNDKQQLINWLTTDMGLAADHVWLAEDGMVTVQVFTGSFSDIIRKLKDGRFAFTQLSDITAVDYPHRPKRFEVVYHLLSMSENLRIRLKLEVAEDEAIGSLQEIYPAADWFEREVWDMYGIFFEGHADLRRILTDYGFQGHPQRKDFPLTGYVEVRYDAESRRVRYDKVNLVQDFRDFDFLSPWNMGGDMNNQQGGGLPGDEKATSKKDETS